MDGDISCKQTKGFCGEALPLLFGRHDDAYLGTMVLGIVVLQIDEAYAYAISLLDDKPQLPVVEEVVRALGYVLLEGEVRERHEGLSTRPQLCVILNEIHQVEVFRLDSSQLQLTAL